MRNIRPDSVRILPASRYDNGTPDPDLNAHTPGSESGFCQPFLRALSESL